MSKQIFESLFDKVERREISVEDALAEIKKMKATNGESTGSTIERYTYDEPCLKDHVIAGKQILIGATHASLAINDFFRQYPSEKCVSLQRLSYFQPVQVEKGEEARIAIIATPDQEKIPFEAKFRLNDTDEWSLAAAGILQPCITDQRTINIEQLKPLLQEFSPLEKIYTLNADAHWGNSYRTIMQLYTGQDQALSRVSLEQARSDNQHAYTLHPLISNSALLTLFPLLTTLDIAGSFLPFGIKEIRFNNDKAPENCWILVKLVKHTSEIIIFDADIINDASEVVISYTGYSLKKVRIPVSVNVPAEAPPVAVPPVAAATAAVAGLEGKVITYLLNKLRKIGGVKISGAEANLMEAGITSAQLVNIANMLADETQLELNPTLFFEYPNIKELAIFFCQEYEDTFIRLLGDMGGKTHAVRSAAETATVPPVKPTPEPLAAPAAKPAPQRQYNRGDMAVIGMHGVFAGAKNPEQFWENLREGKDLITEIPLDHWDYRPWFDENPEAKDSTYCKWGSFISDVDKFDAGFFKISPREADWMDPQLRLLLQSIYNTGEDAGYINQLRSTNTGVFVGVCFHDYLEMIAEKRYPADPYIGTGNGQTVTANRVSFYFDFKGPSIAYNTACSSSLSALHAACQALRNNECNMAFVSGVNLLFASSHYRYFCSIGALSPTGHCYSFDERANGYVPGEAVTSILLKPLEQAEKDGDRIYAVIKGSAALHGGYTPSLTAPSVVGEENVILKAWEDAGVPPETITYIEAHGTGTRLGDPIEINSLKKAFRRFTGKEQFCTVGSAKASIGHVEGASGMAGILKVILQMQHRQLPAMPNYKQLNSYIQLEKSALKINQELQEWKTAAGIPRRAGVSSFGFSGAYAHVVLEEYIAKEDASPCISAGDDFPAIIPLSARNEDRLRAQATQLLEYINGHALSETDLVNIAYTLQTAREAMDERVAFMVYSIDELREKLSAYIHNSDTLSDIFTGHAKSNKDTVAIFTGDEDLAYAIDTWITKAKYSKLLELWVKGFSFNWLKLYNGSKPRIISLPGYPFAKERYWVPEPTNLPEPETKVKERNTNKTAADTTNLLTLTPVWETTVVSKLPASPAATENVLIAGGTAAERNILLQYYPQAYLLNPAEATTADQLAAMLPQDPFTHIIWLAPQIDPVTAATAPETGLFSCFRLVKALLQKGYAATSLGWTIITRQCAAVHLQDSIDATHASVHGLAGSMAKEYPLWRIRLADIPATAILPWEQIAVLPSDADGNALAYRNEQWYRQELALLEQPATHDTLYRKGGVYVVIGGAGGIGSAWTEYMIRTYQAQIIWIGRSVRDTAIQAKLEKLSAPGITPEYVQADAASLTELTTAYHHIRSAYGTINGIIQSAIVLSDQSLANMDESIFEQALRAKAGVSVCMATVFKEEPLDFVLFFSSIISFFKTPGQSNYAAGSTFEDAFAKQLSQQWPCVVKTMNWGYWGSIGIVAGDAYRSRMAAAGMGSIEPPEAMEALEQLLTLPVDQMVLIKTIGSAGVETQLPVKERIGVLRNTIPAVLENISANISAATGLVKPPGNELLVSYRETDVLLGKLLWMQLQSLGLLHEKQFILAALQAGLQPRYHRWLEQSLVFLSGQHYLEQAGDWFTIIPRSAENPDGVWQQLLSSSEQEENKKAQLALAAIMLKALPDILSGRKLATDVMFPDASMKLVEGIYRGNTVSDYFNAVLEKTVITYITSRLQKDASQKIRILEIGAGTGGTSAGLFEQLRPYAAVIQEYCYTDLSRAFIMHAETVFAPAVPYLNCRIFDTTQPLSAQGFVAGTYDLVIASNVLHATGNIHHALRNAKALLARNGLLIMNELSIHSLFAHLTFGLLDGWWLYEDAALRIPGSPGLYPEQWERVLKQEGFANVLFPAATSHQWGQQIIAAESDGIIRQPLSASPVVLETAPVRIAVNVEAQPVVAKIHEPQVGITVEDTTAAVMHDELPEKMSLIDIRELIIEKLGIALKINAGKIDPEEPFADYGLDSITGVKLVQLINEGLQLQLLTTTIFDYSTASRLAAHLFSTCQIVVSPVAEKPVPPQAPIRPAAPVPPVTPASPVAPIAPVAHTPLQTNSRQPVFAEKVTARVLQTSEKAPVSGNEKEPIAIIGMSGRFPQSDSVGELWEHLLHGKDLVEKVTRWDLAAHDVAFADTEKALCRYGGFLRNIDRFDPLFFNISGLEATYMDPQQRLFLEEGWKALEDAGYAGSNMEGKLCGVYVGYNGGGYNQLFGNNAPAQAFWGNAAAVIPARISYYLDLQGPAIAVDTACSSSLVAIHLACQGLWTNETEMAVAGGVFIQTIPWFYLSGTKAEMLSPTGHCYTFDDRADGFVPAEGVGVVVLKRLKDALADGDHIHGVIRASGINQDGTTNGITAPSARSQERLECQVYNSFNVNPADIQLVEAHGTGTKLGDPIEFNALTNAFRKFTDKQSYCAIGSVKTNIGHAAAAAGMAGLIKVLLSLKHQQLPPSLHYVKGNASIRFEGSPFYVNTDLKDWEVTAGKKRTAVVSAFGFSGTNAHMVIEQAPELQRQHVAKPAYMIVLSAHTTIQLEERVRQLLGFCEQEPGTDCGNMSFTLLLGRKQLQHRWACVVRDMKDLVSLLRKWLDRGNVTQVYTAAIPEKDRREQPALKKYGNDCISNCRELTNVQEYTEQLSAVAELYVQGYVLDFEMLFAQEGYNRISLPTYPFGGSRYWVKTDPAASLPAVAVAADFIHPLLQRNTADLSGLRYASVFTGKEFFLADHVINDQRIFPGAAYLEMARMAVLQAMGGVLPSRRILQLKNIVWFRPVVVDQQPQTVHIALLPEEDSRISFEIYTEEKTAGTAPVIHSQGYALATESIPVPDLDLPLIKAACNRGVLSAADFYDTFRSLGFYYGPSHQCITAAYIGEERLLASLVLPVEAPAMKAPFVLHPALLDAALQASVGMAIHSGILKPSLPFAIQSLEIHRPCTAAMWAFIRYRNNAAAVQKVQLLDIDLCDEAGSICVRITGFSSRVLEEDNGEKTISTGQNIFYFQPSWKIQEAVQAPQLYDQHLVICCGPDGITAETIVSRMSGVKGITLLSQETDTATRFSEYAVQLFNTIQSLLNNRSGKKVLIQLLTDDRPSQQLNVSLSAMLKTARLENPLFIGQLIQTTVGTSLDTLVPWMEQCAQSPGDTEIRYHSGKRWVAAWEEVTLSAAPSLPWKAGGVYLITGGAGGLGELLTAGIVANTKDVTLVLCGRSALPPDKQQRINGIAAKVIYKQADVSDAQQVHALIQEIRVSYGRLDGIIHAAGVIRDNFLLKKTTAEVQEVLAPKVAGLINLDEASKDLPLDFLILFSAGAGAIGNPGQADYATANAFMDSYARYRNELVSSGQRHGKTLSVNWPLWESGGMQLSETARTIMLQQTGIVPLQTATGINALYKSLASGFPQLLILAGNAPQLRQFLQVPSTPLAPLIAPSDITGFILQVLSTALQLSPEEIDPHISFDKFGIDSIMQMNLIREWEKITGELPKTILFEYPSVQELSAYFEKHHQHKFIRSRYNTDTLSADTVSSIRTRKKKEPDTPAEQNEDIAVIGISGRYPLSDNLEELWAHLKAGDNCITPLPRHRWTRSLLHTLTGEALLQPAHKYYGGFLREINHFDHHLFDIPPARVPELSPEIRLFLETVWATFENAGYSNLALQDLQTAAETGVGVFVGSMYNQYAWNIPGAEQAVLTSNGTEWQIANRVSHFFNLTGPSIAVNSACSGSLTAIHLACESLRQKNCAMAIAGGINLTLEPSKYVALQHAGFLGSGHESKSFGAGDGYLPGEGVGAVLLKPLSQALKDNDNILGVIKSSFVNHGGGRQMYTAPDPKQQAQLISHVIRRSGIHPSTIGYVESAANGSLLADAIEVVALQQAFEQYTDQQHFCALGAVKSNIGHLEAASGMSQLSKVLLQMKHKTLVPSINASPRNPNIKLEHTAFYLQESLSPWPAIVDDTTGKVLPRRSIINSFGAGGAYAGLIVEEYNINRQETETPTAPGEKQLFVFSAGTSRSLWHYLEKMQQYLEENSAVQVADIARTLQQRNQNLPYRIAVITSSAESLLSVLRLLCSQQGVNGDPDVYVRLEPSGAKPRIAAIALQKSISEKDFPQLATYWIEGSNIDFRGLSPAVGLPDISLPGYVFDHDLSFDFNNTPQDKTEDIFYQELLDKIAGGTISAAEFNQLITS
ncbi:SDR family NAD(P)-dependent oxidoreductase [Chitinophaga niastensis]|nr:SDR family NAD(P)-dependent oxidoreductase [Chitinophaga niastensis]